MTPVSPPAAAGKLSSRRSLGACGVATLAVLALALLPTQAALANTALPDNRVYEMVTPPNNQDADVYVPFAEEAFVSQGVQSFFPFQVALDGSAVT